MGHSAIQISLLTHLLISHASGCAGSETSGEGYTDSTTDADADTDADSDTDSDSDLDRNESSPGSEICHEMQNQFRDICCNPEGGGPNGQYPFRMSIQPTGLGDLGNPSCGDLYWMGRQGSISASLCQQLQQDAQDPCGCLSAE